MSMLTIAPDMRAALMVVHINAAARVEEAVVPAAVRQVEGISPAIVPARGWIVKRGVIAEPNEGRLSNGSIGCKGSE